MNRWATIKSPYGTNSDVLIETNWPMMSDNPYQLKYIACAFLLNSKFLVRYSLLRNT